MAKCRVEFGLEESGVALRVGSHGWEKAMVINYWWGGAEKATEVTESGHFEDDWKTQAKYLRGGNHNWDRMMTSGKFAWSNREKEE